jgi:hypothetical protein
LGVPWPNGYWWFFAKSFSAMEFSELTSQVVEQKWCFAIFAMTRPHITPEKT